MVAMVHIPRAHAGHHLRQLPLSDRLLKLRGLGCADLGLNTRSIQDLLTPERAQHLRRLELRGNAMGNHAWSWWAWHAISLQTRLGQHGNHTGL